VRGHATNARRSSRPASFAIVRGRILDFQGNDRKSLPAETNHADLRLEGGHTGAAWEKKKNSESSRRTGKSPRPKAHLQTRASGREGSGGKKGEKQIGLIFVHLNKKKVKKKEDRDRQRSQTGEKSPAPLRYEKSEPARNPKSTPLPKEPRKKGNHGKKDLPNKRKEVTTAERPRKKGQSIGGSQDLITVAFRTRAEANATSNEKKKKQLRKGPVGSDKTTAVGGRR